MHVFARPAFALAGLLALAPPALANALPQVRVAIPYGLETGFASTTPSAVAGKKYVTIQGVRLVNPSRHAANSFAPKEFGLLAGERRYTPVVRPGEASLDLSQTGILAPGASQLVTVTFLVPDDLTYAKFEFTPHWLSDAGFTVDYCCLYY